MNPDNSVSSRFMLTEITQDDKKVHKNQIFRNQNRNLLILTKQEKNINEETKTTTNTEQERKETEIS